MTRKLVVINVKTVDLIEKKNQQYHHILYVE